MARMTGDYIDESRVCGMKVASLGFNVAQFVGNGAYYWRLYRLIFSNNKDLPRSYVMYSM